MRSCTSLAAAAQGLAHNRFVVGQDAEVGDAGIQGLGHGGMSA